MWGVLVAIAVGVTAPEGAAQVDDATRASARQLGEEGNALYDKGEWAGALEKYDRAAALVSVPTLGLKAARSLEKLGRLVEAAERYLAVTRMGLPADALPVHKQAVVDAETERNALLPRIPAVVITLQGGDAEVALDGKPVPKALLGAKRAVDPGAHRIEARGVGVVRDVTLREGETVPVVLTIPGTTPAAAPLPIVPAAAPAPAPSAAPEADAPSSGSTQRVLGFAALGVGVVGVGVGAVVGLLASGDKSDLEKTCGADLQCPPSEHGNADSYNSKRTISTVGFIVGGVAAAAGVALILTAPSGGGAKSALAPSRPWVEASLGPGWLTVRSVF